jgi:hypothetical protein
VVFAAGVAVDLASEADRMGLRPFLRMCLNRIFKVRAVDSAAGVVVRAVRPVRAVPVRQTPVVAVSYP